MANVSVIPPVEATGRMRELYAAMPTSVTPSGTTTPLHLVEAWSLQPELVDPWLKLRDEAKNRAGIDERQFELMLCRVVYLYKCRYVTVNHAMILATVGAYTHDQVKRYIKEWENSDLAPADKALLRFAEKVAMRSQDITRKDVEDLLAYGFTEANVVALSYLVGWLVTDAIIPNALGPDLDYHSKEYRDIPDW